MVIGSKAQLQQRGISLSKSHVKSGPEYLITDWNKCLCKKATVVVLSQRHLSRVIRSVIFVRLVAHFWSRHKASQLRTTSFVQDKTPEPPGATRIFSAKCCTRLKFCTCQGSKKLCWLFARCWDFVVQGRNVFVGIKIIAALSALGV